MFKVWYKHVWQTSWRYLWLVLVPLIIGLLQWLLNIEELQFFLFGGQISFIEGLDIIVDGIFSVFTLPTDFTPIAFIIISVLQASAITLLFRLRSARKAGRRAAKQAGSLGVAVIGAGCVACGGSLVTPLLSLVAVNISVGFASVIGDILLMLAIVMSYLALKQVTEHEYFKIGAK